MIRKTLVAAAAVSMAVAPIGAQAAERHSSATKAPEHLAGTPALGWLIGLAIVAGVIAIIASDHNHSNTPVSP